MSLSLRRVPDPVLRAVCAPVERFDGRLRDLAAAMLDAMYAAPGRGLAAAQVGEALRLFVMDATWKEGRPDPRAFANPEIVDASAETATAEEGCLSIPDALATVERPARVRLRWRDLDGAAHEGDFDGFAARCVQHEIDHLDGVLMTDRARR